MKLGFWLADSRLYIRLDLTSEQMVSHNCYCSHDEEVLELDVKSGLLYCNKVGDYIYSIRSKVCSRTGNTCVARKGHAPTNS
jgi:hypothetical protein